MPREGETKPFPQVVDRFTITSRDKWNVHGRCSCGAPAVFSTGHVQRAIRLGLDLMCGACRKATKPSRQERAKREFFISSSLDGKPR